jgi:hypothetical protein
VLTHNHELHRLLDSVADTREIVVRRADADDALLAAWEAARDDAIEAWTAWVARAGPDRPAAWTTYVAARDREDAALEALIASAPLDVVA